MADTKERNVENGTENPVKDYSTLSIAELESELLGGKNTAEIQRFLDDKREAAKAEGQSGGKTEVLGAKSGAEAVVASEVAKPHEERKSLEVAAASLAEGIPAQHLSGTVGSRNQGAAR